MKRSKQWKRSSLVVAVIAIVIGAIGKFKPSLFMTLPFPVSLLCWLATGNSAPPFIQPDPWINDDVKTWTRSGDVVVAVGGKSGTTFLSYCAHQIRLKGADDADALFGDIYRAVLWPELVQSRHGSWAEQKPRYNTTVLPDGTKLKDYWDNDRYPFRIFKTHYSPRESGGLLPVTDNPQLKFIACARNGLDVLASFVNFFSGHTDEFRRLWGGFPPRSTGKWEVDAERRLQEGLPSGILGKFYFGYVQEWWKLRHEPNVLLLHYSDIRKDLAGTITKIANFLEVALTDGEHATVTERCSLDHMKENEHMFLGTLPLSLDSDLWDQETMRLISPKEMIRTGHVNKGRDLFTDEQVERWERAEEEVFGSIDPQLLKWARDGGAFD